MIVRLALPRSLATAYAAAALALSVGLLAMSLRRGSAEAWAWLAAWLVTAVFAARRPDSGPLAAGFLAFLLGFVRTYRHGPNLDLGLSLVLLALGVHLLARRKRDAALDLPGLLLLGVSLSSLVSLAFAVARIRAFAPAPGFSYHVYRINPLGFSSEEALLRVILNAALTFCWFGAYQYARSVRLDRERLSIAVLAALALDSAALVVQARFAPGFLHPAGWPSFDRLNGVTSFCYALGDVMLALFLLLPVWGSLRGRRAVLTVASLALLLHGVVASGSRTALATIVAVSVSWTALRVGRLAKRGKTLAGTGMAAAAALLLASLALAYVKTPADQSTPLGRLKEGVERQGWFGHVFATRLTSYPLAFRVLLEYPLSGVGAGLYPIEIDKQRRLLMPELRLLDPFLETSYAPNQLLNTGVELGIPAMAALAAALALAAWSALSRRDPEAADLGMGVLGLAAALQLGPGLHNSEALVFSWLLVGAAAAAGAPPVDRPGDPRPAWRGGARLTTAWLALWLALAAAGHTLAWPALSVDSQWRKLRWRMNIGMQPAQPDGQWTAPEATFSVDDDAPALAVRWHAGDPAAATYRPDVSFFVDGRLVARSAASAGRIRETVLPLPAVSGFKRISIRVVPPFVPADFLGGTDHRSLGLFLHSVTPRGKGAGTKAALPTAVISEPSMPK